MSLDALPGPSGGLMPKHLGLRPCTYHPAQWWELGHPNVERAKELCRTECPRDCFAACPPISGMVSAAVLRDERGRVIPDPCYCGECRRCKGVVADHHDTIAVMRSVGYPFREIADRIGFGEDATRVYWHSRGKWKGVNKNARNAAERGAGSGPVGSDLDGPAVDGPDLDLAAG